MILRQPLLQTRRQQQLLLTVTSYEVLGHTNILLNPPDSTLYATATTKSGSIPLTRQSQAVLAVWLEERGGQREDPLFPTRTGRRLSRDAVERRVTIHAAVATQQCASLKGKRLHPHVLRRSCAMSLLQAGVDSTVIALWLGHADVRSTTPYIHADMTVKERALALVTPASVTPGRYKPPDSVLAFLDSLG